MGLFAAKAAFDNQLVFGIIKNFFSDQLCPLVVTDTSVCWGGSNIIGGELLNVIAKSFFDPLYFCEDIIPVCRNDEFKFYHAESYANRILSTKPEILKQNNYLEGLYESATGKNRKILKVVHFTDPHIDSLYKEGSDALCPQYLCCREMNGMSEDPLRRAGKWGSYHCDMPALTLQLMFDYIKEQIQPDIIVWTGDNSAHSVWNNTVEEVIESTKNITLMLQNTFNGTNATIIPIQGNHDLWPANDQDFSKPNGVSIILDYAQLWLDAGWLDS